MPLYQILIVFILVLTACSSNNETNMQGYIEGDYTYISSPVSGKLIKLFTTKGQRIKKGAPLFSLEEEPDNYAYLSAKANWQQAIDSQKVMQANLRYAKQNYERNRRLSEKNAAPQALLDQTQSAYLAALAQLQAANASVQSTRETMNQFKWRTQQKKLVALQDALIFDKYYNEGEYVEAGKPVFSLLTSDNIKVIFFVAEPVLGNIHYQDEVIVQCDGCKNEYRGKINFISPSAEYTPPVIFSLETNQKLSYRVEAIFPAEKAYELHPGQPVRVRL